MRLPLLPTIAVILVSTSACGSPGGSEDAKFNKSANMQQGYEDGCASATQQGADLRGRLVQDTALYKADPAYRAGWSNGFSSCRTTTTAPGTQPGANPLGGPLPGTH